LKLLTITLNLLFLFIFGAGQICFCTESDNCQGATNISFAGKVASSDRKVFQSECTSASSQDCCADCFNSTDVAALAGNLFDGSNFESAGPMSSWTTFAIFKNDKAERPRMRAPPDGFGNLVTKIYLAKQSLLI